MRLILPCLAIAAILFASAAARAQQTVQQTPQPASTPESDDTSTRRAERRSRSNSTNPATDTQLERDSRDRAKDRKKKSEATKDPVDPNKAGQKPEDQGRKARGDKPKGTAGGAARGGEARGSTSVEFKISANPYTNVLFLESISAAPTMNILANEGDQFATRAVLANGRKSMFDTVEVSLKYDPAVLSPLGIDDSDLQPYMLESALARIDRNRGILAYRVELTDPVNFDRFTLFKVAWKALRPAELTRIAFLNSEDYPSRILAGSRNMLQTIGEDGEIEMSDGAGLLNADVTVIPSGAVVSEDGVDDDPADLSALAMATRISAGIAEGEVQLGLRPRANVVTSGEEFLVDLVYKNPGRAEIDLFKVKLRFDPDVLEVVDYDEDNWITRGINIYDGSYHEELPFDFHLRNVALNATGNIAYEMGFRSQASVPESGVLATIRFRAKKPAATTEIAFDFREESAENETSVSFLGFNLIGVPGQRQSALANAVVRVD